MELPGLANRRTDGSISPWSFLLIAAYELSGPLVARPAVRKAPGSVVVLCETRGDPIMESRRFVGFACGSALGNGVVDEPELDESELLDPLKESDRRGNDVSS